MRWYTLGSSVIIALSKCKMTARHLIKAALRGLALGVLANHHQAVFRLITSNSLIVISSSPRPGIPDALLI